MVNGMFCYLQNGFSYTINYSSVHVCSLGYAVWMLEKILEKYSGSEVFVMYDIACSLFKHLKVHYFLD